MSLATWPPAVVYARLRDRLRDIQVANGYNTSPRVFDDFVTPDRVTAGDLPYLCLEVVGLGDRSTTFGADDNFASLTEDADLEVIVWGAIEDEVNRNAAALALAEDVLAAIWSEQATGDLAVITRLQRIDFAGLAEGTPAKALIAVQLLVHTQFDREWS